MLDDLSTKDKLLLAFIGIIILAGAIENAGALILLMILGGLAYFDNNRRQNKEQKYVEMQRQADYRQRTEDSRRRYDEPRQERPKADQVYSHALQAARAAGLNPDTVPVLPVDLGIMAYHGDTPPVIHRTVPVEDDCDYIQPFIQLRVPSAATGTVRFELLDNTGKVIFIHEDSYQLKRGRNLIVPSSRLPIHDEQESDGAWELQVSGDNMLLAKYRFDWLDMERSDAQRFVGEDGELNSEMRAVLAESRLQKMSLDDLLAPQDDEAPPQQAKR